jgi:hypothetical protein
MGDIQGTSVLQKEALAANHGVHVGAEPELCAVLQVASLVSVLPAILHMQAVPRLSWLGMSKLSASDIRSKQFSAAICQPPRPTVLLPHALPNSIHTLLPFWKVDGAVLQGSACWAVSCSAPVAARIRDKVSAAQGSGQQLNFTPQQWALVST